MVLSPLVFAIVIAVFTGVPPATGMNADVPFAFEEHDMVDADKRRKWNISTPGFVLGLGVGASAVLTIAKLYLI